MKVALYLAIAELRGGFKGFYVLLLCLALGVTAITAIGSLRLALERGLMENGAVLLGGDAEVSLTYRFATQKETKTLSENSLQLSEIADFRSMARAGEHRVLTQIKAVDSAYPLIGQVTLDPPQTLATALAAQDGLSGAVLAPALMARLGVTVGDQITLGTKAFRVSAALLTEPDSLGQGISIGPRTLVMRSALEGADLLAPGTLFNSSYRLTVPAGTDLSKLQTELETALPDSGITWRDARNAAPQAAEFISRISTFLVLIGFSGLAMGGIGVSLSVQAYMTRKTTVIATLRSLGAPRKTILASYGIQIAVIAVIGVGLGLAFGVLLPLLLGPLLAQLLPVPASFGVYAAPLLEAALYGGLIAFIFALWPLARSETVGAATLFRESSARGAGLPRWPYLALTGLAALALVTAAITFSGNARMTLYTVAALTLALTVLALAALALRSLARRLLKRETLSPQHRLALASIASRRSDAVTTVIALGLGLAVLAFVGQVDGNLRRAIAGELPDVAPAFFLIDIQRAQLPEIEAKLTSHPVITKLESAPMLRGILSKINGQPAAQVAGDHWVLGGDRGITYYETLPENGSLTAGETWPKGANGPPQVSFAAEEAEEMGLALGDMLTLNILGRPIEAEITSFREVDFSSAGIGFIIAMNPGALAGAPHSLIATVYTKPEAGLASETSLLRDISEAFPNVTAIPVREAIERVARIFATLANATRWGASAAVLAGVVVLLGAAASGAPARAQEAAILKSIGATQHRILASFLMRAAFTGLAAGAIAVLAGLAGAWATSRFLFDLESFSVIWPSAFLILTCGMLANLAAFAGFSFQALRTRPSRILRAAD